MLFQFHEYDKLYFCLIKILNSNFFKLINIYWVSWLSNKFVKEVIPLDIADNNKTLFDILFEPGKKTVPLTQETGFNFKKFFIIKIYSN